jgi:hypothetical protein
MQWKEHIKLRKVFRLLPLILVLARPAAVEAQFNYTTNNGTITITGYTGAGGAVTIPTAINGLPVSSIGEWAFYAASVSNILIPDSVTNIADGAFFDCTSLTNAVIGDSVASIGDWTFAFCSSLTSVCFRGNAPSLGGTNVCYGCGATVYYLLGTAGWGSTLGGLPAVLWNPPVPFNYTTNGETITITAYTGSSESVVIPATINFLPITSVGVYAFANCTSVTSVTIPDSATSIGYRVFQCCFSLTSVTIPVSVTNIAAYAFYDCFSLTSITIPSGVTSIEDGVFFECHSLTNVTIPRSVTDIGVAAFAFCFCLTNVTIPDSVTNIGTPAFIGCRHMSAITVHPDNPAYSSVAGVLFDKNQTMLVKCPAGIASVTIPDSVTNIAKYAFDGCTCLTSVTIPSSVTSIGTNAFSGCISLTSVTIPRSITSIEDYAFANCTSLSQVYFTGNAPSVAPDTFLGDNGTVYCLPGTRGWHTPFAGLPVAVWNPKAQSLGVRTNWFGFNITGTPNIPIGVVASTNLSGAAWTLLLSGTLTNGSIYFSDPAWTNYPARFYRIRSP